MAHSKPWAKLWVSWYHKPEWVSLSLAEQGAWWRLYSLAQERGAHGRICYENGRALTLEEMTSTLHITRKADVKVFCDMIEKCIHHGKLRWDAATLLLTDFAKEQQLMPSSDSGDRVKRYRARAAVVDKSLEELGADIREELVALPTRSSPEAQYDQWLDALARMGAENGLNPRSEYATARGPLDFAWEVPRSTRPPRDEHLLVAFAIDRTPREKTLAKLEATDCPFRLLLSTDPSPFTMEGNVLVVGLGKERERTKERETLPEEEERGYRGKTRNGVTPVTSDPVLALITQLHKKNFGNLSPIIAKKMKVFCETFKGDESWVRPAFEEALARKKRTWGYVEAILTSMENEGGPRGQREQRKDAPDGETGRDPLEETRRAGWTVTRLSDVDDGDDD